MGPSSRSYPVSVGRQGERRPSKRARGTGVGVPHAGQGIPRGQDRPALLRGAASRHTRADVPAAQQGAGPHLPAPDPGLESSRRAARTCPAGRHRGVLGESNRKIPAAWGCEEEEEDWRHRGERALPGEAEILSHQLPGAPVSVCKRHSAYPIELITLVSSISLNLEVFYCSCFADA